MQCLILKGGQAGYIFLPKPTELGGILGYWVMGVLQEVVEHIGYFMALQHIALHCNIATYCITLHCIALERIAL